MHLVKIVLIAFAAGLLIDVGIINLAVGNSPDLKVAWISMIITGMFLGGLLLRRPWRAQNHTEKELIPSTTEPQERPFQQVNSKTLIQLAETFLSSGIIQVKLMAGNCQEQISILRCTTLPYTEYTLTVTITEWLALKKGDLCEGELRTTEQFTLTTREANIRRTIIHKCLPRPDVILKLPRNEYSLDRRHRMENRHLFEAQFEYANESELKALLELLKRAANSHGVTLDG